MEIRARLDKNESPLDVPEVIKNRMVELGRMVNFARYDGPHFDDLRAALAETAGVTPSNVMVANGADECILTISLAFGGPHTTIVIPSPTFVTYTDSAAWSKSHIAVVPRPEPDFALDVDGIIETLEGRTRKRSRKQSGLEAVVFVCRPNNPTGNLCPEQDVARLLGVPGLLVVVDEAYYEISGATLVPWVRDNDNLVIIRTLSKAYSIAGLRIGYLIAAPALVEHVAPFRLPFSVNVFSQAAALVALKERSYFMRWGAEMGRSCKELQTSLAAIPGVTVLPSVTNFVLFRTPLLATHLYGRLKDRGVLTRHYPTEPGLKHYVRVSVGTKEENALFLRELESVLRSSA